MCFYLGTCVPFHASVGDNSEGCSVHPDFCRALLWVAVSPTRDSPRALWGWKR